MAEPKKSSGPSGGDGAKKPTLDEWRAEAWAAESSELVRAAREALAQPSSPEQLRELSIGARALAGGVEGPPASVEDRPANVSDPPARAGGGGRGGRGDPAARARAVECVVWGLSTQKNEQAWDALHVAAELALAETRPQIDQLLASTKVPFVRGMALLALGKILPLAEAKATLDRARREDVSWVARQIAQDGLMLLEGKVDPTPPLFSRWGYLAKTFRVRVRSPIAPYGVDRWLKLGVALPPAPRLFFAAVQGGGICELQDEGVGTDVVRRGTLALRAPEDAPKATARLTDLNDYVWARYVDMAKKLPTVDEEQALRRYADFYDDPRRPLDRDAWAYGVLLFEGAFRDEAKRAERLLRAREVLEGQIAVTGEADWDVVADRLAEAKDMIAKDGLETARRAPRLFPIGTFAGLELFVDAAQPGPAPVFARALEEEEDDDEALSSEHRAVAAKIAAKEPELFELSSAFARWVNDPRGAVLPPATAEAPISFESVRAVGGEASALVLLAEAKRLADEREWKKAGRLHLDALELEASKQVVAAAARFLERKELDPARATELLAEMTVANDKKGEKIVQLILGELADDRAKEILAALEKLDRAGGGETSAARLVDVIASLRPKALQPLRDAARVIRERRGEAQLRTVKNKWYKPYKKQ